MFKKISAIILLVADAPKLIGFYRDVLGLEVKQELDNTHNVLIGFNVSDLDSVCKELDNKGVSFFKRPAEESFGKHAIIEDPEGNLISIAELKLKDEYTQISYYHGFAPE